MRLDRVDLTPNLKPSSKVTFQFQPPKFQGDSFSLSERHASLEKVLTALAPQKINIPSPLVIGLNEIPQSVKAQYSKVLNDVSPSDLTSFANKDYMGIVEELADLAHNFVQCLAVETGTIQKQDFQQFIDEARPMASQKQDRFQAMKGLTQKFVSTIPWKRPASFLQFTRINGTDKGRPNYDAEASLTSQQLSDFMGNFFVSELVRRKMNHSPGFSDPKKFLVGEHEELKENIMRWAENPEHADKKEAALKALKGLDKAVEGFLTEPTPDNARVGFKQIGNVGKAIIGVDHLPIRILFEYLMTKQMGRMSGVYLENLETLNGKNGYDSGKTKMKAFEALVEAATLKKIFANDAANKQATKPLSLSA